MQKNENEISNCQSGFGPKTGSQEDTFNLKTVIG